MKTRLLSGGTVFCGETIVPERLAGFQLSFNFTERKMYEEVLNSPVSRYITAMAHPFEAVCCPYDNRILIQMIEDDVFRRLFDKTAEQGIAVEINVCAMNGKTRAEIAQAEQMRM